MPRLYDIAWTKPPPLIERHLRVVVDERIDHLGRWCGHSMPRMPSALCGRCSTRTSKRSRSACCTPTPIRRTSGRSRRVRRLAPGLPVSISSEVLPEIKEYERTSSTVINALRQLSPVIWSGWDVT